MDSFQAKIGWKNIMDNSKKIAKKLKILKKYHYLCGFISIENRLEKAEKKRK